MTSNPLLDAALAYAARGWPIFPCNPDKSPKTPNGVGDATTNPQVIGEWWARWPRAGIGCDLGGAGMMALDLDPGSSYEALDRHVGGLPKTLLVQNTPRGGQHLFFALAEGEIVPPSVAKAGGVERFGPHVDVRSFNSYVLLAPSATADGVYTWASEGKPAYRSDEMKRLACIGVEKSKHRDDWIIAADIPENVERAIEWLKGPAKPAIKKGHTSPEGIVGGGGNGMAYATGAMMKSLGLSEPTAFDLMWEHWAPRCTPAWYSSETLSTAIEHAYQYNTSPPGNMTPAYKQAKAASMFRAPAQVRAPDAEGVEFISGPYRFVNRDGMASIVPPTWVVNDFIPSEAYAMLFAAPETFKSFIAIDIALEIVTGGMCANPTWDIVKAGNVLYAAGEGRSAITKRVEAWERQHWYGERVQGLVLADPVPSIMEKWEPFYEGALRLSPEGYALTVIDTAGMSMGGANEGAFETASLFTKRVRETIQVLGGSVLVIHHVGHDTHGRPIGSSAFIRDPDTMVRVDRAGNAMVVSLTMTKQRDGTKWDRAKGVALIENGNSIVATKAAPPPAQASTAAKQKDRKADATAIFEASVMDKHIDAVIKDELGHNKTTSYSTRTMADILANREDIEIGVDHLRLRVLPRLTGTAGTYASKAYRPKARPSEKWHYWEVGSELK